MALKRPSVLKKSTARQCRRSVYFPEAAQARLIPWEPPACVRRGTRPGQAGAAWPLRGASRPQARTNAHHAAAAQGPAAYYRRWLIRLAKAELHGWVLPGHNRMREAKAWRFVTGGWFFGLPPVAAIAEGGAGNHQSNWAKPAIFQEYGCVGEGMWGQDGTPHCSKNVTVPS
jgi:hypothetical protein